MARSGRFVARSGLTGDTSWPIRSSYRRSQPIISENGVVVTNAKTVIYPVSDLAKAKEVFTPLVGAQPYVDEVYYVGYQADGDDRGLLQDR